MVTYHGYWGSIMIVARLLSLAAGFVCASTVHAAEPFDLRGIKLGVTLSDFRKMPHPDGQQTKVICTGDPDAKRRVLFASDDEDAAGVRVCNHYEFKKLFASSSLPPEWTETSLNVATINVFMTYKFVPDTKRGNEPALYSIIVRSNVTNWNKFWEGYNGKYGKPQSVSNASTQNRAGATFDNVTATWENDQSSITLIKRFSRIDNTYILYEHQRLAAEIKRRVQQKKGKPSDKL